jgi:hypothetical protein
VPRTSVANHSGESPSKLKETRFAATTSEPKPLGKLVDLGGHHLHVNCTDKGSPTVVVERFLLRLDPGAISGFSFYAHLHLRSGWICLERPGPQTAHIFTGDSRTARRSLQAQ